jgi:hypothetical protein
VAHALQERPPGSAICVGFSGTEPDMGTHLPMFSLGDWDPILVEVEHLSSWVGQSCRSLGSPVLDGPDVDSLVLEPVFFSDATAHQEAPAHQDRRFVNTLREAAPLEMELGIIPSSPPSYTQVVAAPLVALMIPSPLEPPTSCGCPLLQRTSGQEGGQSTTRGGGGTESTYEETEPPLPWQGQHGELRPRLFAYGLTKQQAELIAGLFMPQTLAPDEGVEAEA